MLIIEVDHEVGFRKPTRMHAMRIHPEQFSEELQYDEVNVPEPGPEEVLIRVHAAGISPVDWKTTQGQGLAPILDEGTGRPWIPGWDISGAIKKVGSDVEHFQMGDEVLGFLGFPKPGAGCAEYLIAHKSTLVLKPEEISFAEASVLPLSSLTAWQALFDVADLSAGQNILILGAAGGVGHMAVQLAKWKGAVVTGTASEHNRQFLGRLGVKHFVDYHTTSLQELGQKFDVVFDTVGGDTQQKAWDVLNDDGILVSCHILSERTKNVRGASFLVRHDKEQLENIVGLAKEGKLRPEIDSTFTLEDMDKAFERSQSGHARGKIVVLTKEGNF